MSVKKWVVSPLNKERATKIAEQWDIPFFLAMILEIRGMTKEEEISSFFDQGLGRFDPFEMIDMKKAVDRILQAIDGFEKICIYGDYDADGMTSTALLYSYLESRAANVMYYIPQRETEGYGMNIEAVDHLHELGVNLIVTVDNGIASVAEVEHANRLGMQVVVTDHHQPQGSLPPAVAVVDPHRSDCPSSFKDWAGVGVAFQLIYALEGEDGDQESLLNNYADLVTVGTIGDIVPLSGENRRMVRIGLSHLSRTDRVGLKALIEEAGLEGKKLTASNVAFTIVPRINALGRLSSSEQAVRLLLSEYQEEADSLASQMGEKNRERQAIEADILKQVAELLEREPERKQQRVLVVEGEGWHEGVIGIVASRVVEKYGKPCIVLSISGNDAKGSSRSVEGFSLYDAIYACRDRLTRFGGHHMAAGLSLKAEQIKGFREDINRYAASLPDGMPSPVLHIDCKLNPAALSTELVDQMAAMEPFGSGNPAPLFGLYQMRLTGITPVGGGKHLRLTFQRENHTVTAMRFRMTPQELPYRIGDVLDLAVTLDKSEFRGQESLTVVIREMKDSAFSEEDYIREKNWYEAALREEELSSEALDCLIPNREEFAVVYRYLRSQKGWSYGMDVLCSRLQGQGLGYGKLAVILSIMNELQLVTAHMDGDLCQVAMLEVAGKVDLNSSCILAGLRQKRCGEQYAQQIVK